MQMHMVLACPILTPPSHRNPGSAKSAEFLLEIVINNAARVAGHGKALFSSVREATGILKLVWKPRKGQEKIPFS